jgi:hypothetical protein
MDGDLRRFKKILEAPWLIYVILKGIGKVSNRFYKFSFLMLIGYEWKKRWRQNVPLVNCRWSHLTFNPNILMLIPFIYSWLSLSRTRLTWIFGWVEFLSKSRTSLCINIYNFTPVESNSDESKFRLSRIKVLVPRCKKPYYLHSLSQIYLSKHVYYLGIKIGSQVKHPVIDFDIFTLGYFTCLFHNLSD